MSRKRAPAPGRPSSCSRSRQAWLSLPRARARRQRPHETVARAAGSHRCDLRLVDCTATKRTAEHHDGGFACSLPHARNALEKARRPSRDCPSRRSLIPRSLWRSGERRFKPFSHGDAHRNFALVGTRAGTIAPRRRDPVLARFVRSCRRPGVALGGGFVGWRDHSAADPFAAWRLSPARGSPSPAPLAGTVPIGMRWDDGVLDRLCGEKGGNRQFSKAHF
jgi:hypothetical protein